MHPRISGEGTLTLVAELPSARVCIAANGAGMSRDQVIREEPGTLLHARAKDETSLTASGTPRWRVEPSDIAAAVRPRIDSLLRGATVGSVQRGMDRTIAAIQQALAARHGLRLGIERAMGMQGEVDGPWGFRC